MSIHAHFLDEIRNRLTLSDIIGQRIPVSRAGREFKACCPFHKEKTPSFTINDDKGFYHCFGCGAHGDVLNFVMQHDNLPFPDAVEMLAGQAGLQVPQFSKEESKKAKEEKDLYSLMNDATSWFEDQLGDSKNAPIMDYVKGRGLSMDTINAFRLGYAPPDHQSLRAFLAAKGYTDKQMIAVGLVKQGQKGKDPYVFFRERVMVPVMDRRGRVVAFGGRVLPDHMRAPDRSGYVPAKYMNSAETPIFNKSNVLYGAPQARQAAADSHTLFVVEGYFDVIASHQAGFKGAVAPMGTALTEEQVMLLWKMCVDEYKEPVLCFDGDNAGRRAAERAAERIIPLLGAGRSVKFAFLPDGEDPDSLIASSGKSALAKILENALPMVEFLWYYQTAGRSFDSPENRAALTKTLQEMIARIPDREVQRHYDYFIKQKINDTFFSRPKTQHGSSGYVGQNNGRWNNSGFNKKNVKPAMPLKSPRQQQGDIRNRVLVAAIVNYPDIFEGVEEAFAGLVIHNSPLDKLRQTVITALNEEPGLDKEVLKTHLIKHGHGEVLELILSPATYLHGKFCAPSDTADSGVIREKWLNLWQECGSDTINKEMKAGWKHAFYSSSEEDEVRMRQILLEKSTDQE